MSESMLFDRCKINTNQENDRFVGVRCIDGDISISFPIGFSLEKDERQTRKDILLLMDVLKKNTDHKESEITLSNNDKVSNFPLRAYLSIISDYYNRGYFQETESVFVKSKSGKINWNRTVKQSQAYVQGQEIFFLDFITRKKRNRDDDMITMIHKYCVYESFLKIGWLFTSYLPDKPKIKFNKKLFRSLIKARIPKTFNEKNRQIFASMLEIIDSIGGSGSSMNYVYGTSRFEYVWERMIDKAFGVYDKQKYFPKTSWSIGNYKYKNASLEPDTIMLLNNKIYVLDAKYYKYGVTGLISDLPESSSINKQITYGEYIAETDKFRNPDGKSPVVYNAFIMPYSARDNLFGISNKIYCVGKATSDWKKNDGVKQYEEIKGILLDVNWIMRQYGIKNNKLYELAACIENNI